MKKIVIVLGMHRSGTSLVTRGLVSLGLHPGSNLMLDDSDNEKGFWEDIDIYQLNEKIFKELNYNWDKTDAIDFDRFTNLLPLYYKKFFDEAYNIINNRFLQAEQIIIKDPRINLLLSFWGSVFKEFTAEIEYVYVFRNPIETALSLEKRNDVPIKHGIDLWTYYNLSALKLIDKDCLIIDYVDFLNDPVKFLNFFAKNNGLNVSSENLDYFTNEYLDVSMRHQNADNMTSELTEYSAAASQLFELLSKVSNKMILSQSNASKTFIDVNNLFASEIKSPIHQVQFKIYTDYGSGFNNKDSEVFQFNSNTRLFEYKANKKKSIQKIKIKLSRIPCIIKIESIVVSYKGDTAICKIIENNSFYKNGDIYYFENNEPIILLTPPKEKFDLMCIKFQIMPIGIPYYANQLFINRAKIESLITEKNDGQKELERNNKLFESHLREISLLSNQNNEKTEYINFTELEITKKNDRLYEKDIELNKQASQINDLLNDIKNVETELIKSNENAKYLLGNLDQKLKFIKKKETDLDDQRKHIDTLLLDRNEKSAIISNYETEIKIFKEKNIWLKKMLEEKNEKISQLDKKYLFIKTESNDRIYEKDQTVNTLSQQLSSKDDRIYEKDLQIKTLGEQVSKVDFEIEKLHNQLIMKSDEILNLERGIEWNIRSIMMKERKKFMVKRKLLNPFFKMIETWNNLIYPEQYAEYKRNKKLILDSGLYDENYYLMHNADITLNSPNPLKHFIVSGGKEGRSPSDLFDAQFYLEKYQDISESGVNPLVHYLTFGRYEYRAKNWPEYHRMMERLAKCGLDFKHAHLLLPNKNASEDELLIEDSKLFNREYYLTTYPDALKANVDPILHYLMSGLIEERNPSAEFNTSYYLKNNNTNGENPLIHYIKSDRSVNISPIDVTPAQFTAIDHRLSKPAMLEDGLEGRKLRDIDTPLVSIIVSAYNHWQITANCIAAIVDNTDFDETPYEVILADDCSSDDTLHALEYFPGLILARTQENMGYLKNNNNAVKIAKGKYLVILNNDTQVQKHWLSELIQTFDQHPNVGLVGSLLMTPEGLCMDSGNMIKNDGSGDCIGRGFNPNHHSFCYVRECYYVTAACMMVKRSLWEEIGGYDERYAPAYCEDSDFGLEVRKQGYEVLIQPFSRVVHLENISHGSTAREKIIERTSKLYDKWEDELVMHPADMNNIFLDKDLSADKKTIVVVEGWVPAWDTNAGARSFLMFIQLKKALGYNVKLMFNYAYPDDYVDYIHGYQKMGFEVWHPSISEIDWKEWMFTRRYAIDAVFVHRPDVADIVFDWIKDTLNKPIIYFNHDLHFLRMQRELDSGSIQHSVEDIENYKEKELKYLNEATVSSSPSLFEIETLRNDYGVNNCEFIPLFVYDDIEKESISTVTTENIIFVAGFNHKPNVRGCMWFIENIWESIISQAPNTVLHIVGSNPGPEILKLNELPNIVVHGFVSDETLKKLYSEARVAVIPLLSGAGLKGKLLEALFYRVPVVGTSVAFEGCPDIEKVCSPKDTPNQFADDIIELLENDREWLRRSRTGFELICEHFSKNAGLSKMNNIIETALEGIEIPDASKRLMLLENDKDEILKLNSFEKDSFTHSNPQVHVTGMEPEYYYYFYFKHNIPFIQKHAMVISPVSSEFGQGNSILTKVLTSKLKEMGYVIHFIYCPTDQSDVLDNGRQMPWDFVYTIEDNENRLLQLKRDENGIPLPNAHLLDDWFTKELEEKVIEISSKWPIDVCLCNYIWLSKTFELLPNTTLKILETHDKFSYRDTDENVLAGQNHSGWYSTVPEEEKKGLERADHILAVQEDDATFFDTLIDKSKVEVVGCTLPENYLTPKTKDGKMVIGYIAGVNAFNIDQVKKLYAAWEKRPEMVENTELYIAGSIGVWLQKYNPLPKARVEGFLDDISEFYENCHVITNPDFGGTGIKIKCLEALSFGRPLIASERSMNGIDSNSPYHKAQDMEHLLEMVQKLYEDSDEYIAQVDKSREVYEKYVSKNDFSVLLKEWVKNG